MANASWDLVLIDTGQEAVGNQALQLSQAFAFELTIYKIHGTFDWLSNLKGFEYCDSAAPMPKITFGVLPFDYFDVIA